MSDIVWESVVDNQYICKVERLSDYKGLLTVQVGLNGKEIMSKEVGLAYGAMFGPDVCDVNGWQDLVIEFIDSLGEKQ